MTSLLVGTAKPLEQPRELSHPSPYGGCSPGGAHQLSPSHWQHYSSSTARRHGRPRICRSPPRPVFFHGAEPTPPSVVPELPEQLTIKTSSSKKRKVARRLQQDPDLADAHSLDNVLPSSEVDDDPAHSFSAQSLSSTLDVPAYVRSDSQPASSLPQRLQAQGSNLVCADYASSAASSPCASAYADLSIDSDRGGDDTDQGTLTTRGQSPLPYSRRAIMSGDADLPHRSSSPLKRRASSMDPEDGVAKAAGAGAGIVSPDTGTNGVARAMSVEMTDADDSTTVAGPDQVPPPLSEQIKIIETLLKAANEAMPNLGDRAFVVSRLWLDKAKDLKARGKTVGDEGSESSLGPVDNSDIIEETFTDSSGVSFVRLKPGSGLDEFELFPEDAWNLVLAWHGLKEGQQPIIRTAINAAPDAQTAPEVMYELHPTVFTVYRLWSEISAIPIDQELRAKKPGPLRLVRSRKYHAQTFVKEMKTLAKIPLERKVRFHTISPPLPISSNSAPLGTALTPPDSPDRDGHPETWDSLLMSLPSFSTLRGQRIESILPDQTTNSKYNGSSSLQVYDLSTDLTIIIDEGVDNKGYVSTYTGNTRGSERSLPARGARNKTSSPKTDSGRSSPAPQGPVTRGRAPKSKTGRNLGAVGLHNLGNTCYMNSALQCVRSVEELTKYFLTDAYEGEVNTTNPLGYNGRVAMAYMGLLKEIYREGRGSVSPREFKNTVGRCRSTFAGWGQQDSQEFLGFLLDALQEDLSRIIKKPYIEKPDSTDDMINDPDAIREMADKVWDITRKRDDSVIADLFTGMYKSTLKCPECGKISITFDPFNNLTLPLPIENMWSKSVKFFPLNDAPVLFEVELPKNSPIEALKRFLFERTGVSIDRMIGAEEFKGKFFKIYDNDQVVSEEIQSADVPTFHELEAVPTNWPVKTKKPKFRSMLDVDSPPEESRYDSRCDTMVVPVFHRRPQSSSGQMTETAPPHFITLTGQQSSSLDMIRRKVLEKVATFTTWTKLCAYKPPVSLEAGDSDAVVANTSDGDSSGDSKIAAHSVEGEEDLVDVRMKDASQQEKEHTNDSQSVSKLLKLFNRQRPAFVDEQVPLDLEFERLFDLSYFTDGHDGRVPTGWATVEHGRTLPRVADRLPESSTEDGEAQSPQSWKSAGSGNDSSEDEALTEEQAPTRMVDDSSDEDISPITKAAPRQLGRHNQRGMSASQKKFARNKTYGKKGNKRRDKQARNGRDPHKSLHVKPQQQPPAVADGGPLIRLGEGLVVDWDESAWELLFGSALKTESDFQGARTFVDADLETLLDPTVKFNQRRRQTRRSRGITLEECLDEFERAEVLSEQDMWYCPRCKEHRRASKKFDLWKTPDILVAHLKRFSSSGWRRDKLDVLVDFPIQGLDLTSRVLKKEDGQDEIYDLIAVDDHYGGLGGGHYTAYARNFADGEWYNYNDSSVSKVSDPAQVVTTAAYLLFYRRRSSKPLGGHRFADIIDQFDNESGEEQSDDSGEGAGTTRPRPDRLATTTTVTALEGSDDDELPAYDEENGGQVIHNSIEDEGLGGMGDENRPFNGTQDWSFELINTANGKGAAGSEFGSDDVQPDLSDGDRDMEMTSAGQDDEGFNSAEPPPAADAMAQDTLAQVRNQAWERQGIISVPVTGGSDSSSTKVEEIRLDGDVV